MKSRLKLQRALETGTLSNEEQEYIKQFPHIFKIPTAPAKSPQKRKVKSNG